MGMSGGRPKRRRTSAGTAGSGRKAESPVVPKPALKFRSAETLPHVVRSNSLLRVAHEVNVIAIRQNQQVWEGAGQLCQVLVNSQAEDEGARATALSRCSMRPGVQLGGFPSWRRADDQRSGAISPTLPFSSLRHWSFWRGIFRLLHEKRR